jgi:glycosyltransferase involved in cell wall biosynthesis
MREYNPLVSIIMNCYNGEKYLREAIDSVINQTYDNWELVFWDNQSEDKSKEIFETYHDDRMKYFYAPKRTNLSKARNLAISETNGELIAFLDVDDYWSNDKLDLQLDGISSDFDIGFSCGNYLIKNEGENKESLAFSNTLPNGMVFDSLLKKYSVGLVTLMIKKECVDLLGSFNTKHHIIGDFDLVMRLSKHYKMISIQQPIATYRIHGESELANKYPMYIEELGEWINDNKFIESPYMADFIDFVKYRSCLLNAHAQDRSKALSDLQYVSSIALKIKLLVYIFTPKPLRSFFSKIKRSIISRKNKKASV